MTTIIYIQPVRRPDGRKWYVPNTGRITKSGLLLDTFIDNPNGPPLCRRVYNPVLESCRALLNLGITGPFETWRKGCNYPCMRGTIEKAAKLTIVETNEETVRFAKYHPWDRDARARLSKS